MIQPTKWTPEDVKADEDEKSGHVNEQKIVFWYLAVLFLSAYVSFCICLG